MNVVQSILTYSLQKATIGCKRLVQVCSRCAVAVPRPPTAREAYARVGAKFRRQHRLCHVNVYQVYVGFDRHRNLMHTVRYNGYYWNRPGRPTNQRLTTAQPLWRPHVFLQSRQYLFEFSKPILFGDVDANNVSTVFVRWGKWTKALL